MFYSFSAFADVQFDNDQKTYNIIPNSSIKASDMNQIFSNIKNQMMLNKKIPSILHKNFEVFSSGDSISKTKIINQINKISFILNEDVELTSTILSNEINNLLGKAQKEIIRYGNELSLTELACTDSSNNVLNGILLNDASVVELNYGSSWFSQKDYIVNLKNGQFLHIGSQSALNGKIPELYEYENRHFNPYIKIIDAKKYTNDQTEGFIALRNDGTLIPWGYGSGNLGYDTSIPIKKIKENMILQVDGTVTSSSYGIYGFPQYTYSVNITIPYNPPQALDAFILENGKSLVLFDNNTIKVNDSNLMISSNLNINTNNGVKDIIEDNSSWISKLYLLKQDGKFFSIEGNCITCSNFLNEIQHYRNSNPIRKVHLYKSMPGNMLFIHMNGKISWYSQSQNEMIKQFFENRPPEMDDSTFENSLIQMYPMLITMEYLTNMINSENKKIDDIIEDDSGNLLILFADSSIRFYSSEIIQIMHPQNGYPSNALNDLLESQPIDIGINSPVQEIIPMNNGFIIKHNNSFKLWGRINNSNANTVLTNLQNEGTIKKIIKLNGGISVLFTNGKVRTIGHNYDNVFNQSSIESLSHNCIEVNNSTECLPFTAQNMFSIDNNLFFINGSRLDILAGTWNNNQIPSYIHSQFSEIITQFSSNNYNHSEKKCYASICEAGYREFNGQCLKIPLLSNDSLQNLKKSADACYINNNEVNSIFGLNISNAEYLELIPSKTITKFSTKEDLALNNWEMQNQELGVGIQTTTGSIDSTGRSRISPNFINQLNVPVSTIKKSFHDTVTGNELTVLNNGGSYFIASSYEASMIQSEVESVNFSNYPDIKKVSFIRDSIVIHFVDNSFLAIGQSCNEQNLLNNGISQTDTVQFIQAHNQGFLFVKSNGELRFCGNEWNKPSEALMSQTILSPVIKGISIMNNLALLLEDGRVLFDSPSVSQTTIDIQINNKKNKDIFLTEKALISQRDDKTVHIIPYNWNHIYSQIIDINDNILVKEISFTHTNIILLTTTNIGYVIGDFTNPALQSTGLSVLNAYHVIATLRGVLIYNNAGELINTQMFTDSERSVLKNKGLLDLESSIAIKHTNYLGGIVILNNNEIKFITIPENKPLSLDSMLPYYIGQISHYNVINKTLQSYNRSSINTSKNIKYIHPTSHLFILIMEDGSYNIISSYNNNTNTFLIDMFPETIPKTNYQAPSCLISKCKEGFDLSIDRKSCI